MSKNKVPLEDSSDELENDEEAQQLIRQAEEKKRAKSKPTEPPTTPKKPSSADHPLTPSRSSPRKTPRKTPNKECYSILSNKPLSSDIFETRIFSIASEAILTDPGENAKKDPNQNTDENSCENAK